MNRKTKNRTDNRINNWKYWLIGTIVFLIAVHILFNIHPPYKWLEAVWSAGDLITLVGTLVLGYIAIKQTNEANERTEAANEISRRLMDLEFERYKLENRPFVMVSDWNAENLLLDQIYTPKEIYIQIGSFDECRPILGLSLSFQNTTNAPLSIEYNDGYIGEHKLMHSATNQPKQKLMLQPFDIKKMIFYASEETILQFKGKTLNMDFILENRFAERYKESFSIIVARIDDLAGLPPKKWFCSLFVQNYQIGKFKRNENGEIVLVAEDTYNGQAENGNP